MWPIALQGHDVIGIAQTGTGKTLVAHALPAVGSGRVAVPVVAVPTSTGYGAAFGGVSALLNMLNSCSPGVGVVNIDNGFGAAYLAATILRGAGHLPGAANEP